MKSTLLLAGIVSLCTALLCFFLLSIATNFPLSMTLIDKHGFESTNYQASVSERLIPIYLSIQSVALFVASFYVKNNERV